jgi:tRNA 2-thiouridine synthesizing protein A
MNDITETKVLDATGLLCPMPVVKASKAMRSMASGEVLKILATDRGSVADFPAWASDTGNELLEQHEEDEVFVFFVRKGAER